MYITALRFQYKAGYKNLIIIVIYLSCRCRFSQMLKPVFEDAAKRIKEQYPVCCDINDI
jgi:hypothetical protein